MEASHETDFESVHDCRASGSLEPILPPQLEVGRVLIICAPNARGVSTAVAVKKLVEGDGTDVEIRAPSLYTSDQKHSTHPKHFYSSALIELDVTPYDALIIACVPPRPDDYHGFCDALSSVGRRISDSRAERGLDTVVPPVVFLDSRDSATECEQLDAAVIQGMPYTRLLELDPAISSIVRLGAIVHRSSEVGPITDQELKLARGLEAGLRSDPLDPKPRSIKAKTRRARKRRARRKADWVRRVQARIDRTIRALEELDLDYFEARAERSAQCETPVAASFGSVAIVETTGLTDSGIAARRAMERAIENLGTERTPYAIGIAHQVPGKSFDGQAADKITVVRHWTRKDLPPARTVLRAKLGDDFFERYHVVGRSNSLRILLPSNDHNTARIANSIAKALAAEKFPDLSGIRTVLYCGDRGSGKSVISLKSSESSARFGVRSKRIDCDKSAPTSNEFLRLEAAYERARVKFERGMISRHALNRAKRRLEARREQRLREKRPWTPELAVKARSELLAISSSPAYDLIIGDIGGGRTEYNQAGEIVSVDRFTPENITMLSAADAVVVVSRSPESAQEWLRLIETWCDPRTGEPISGKPPRIIGVYQSALEGTVQRVSSGSSGVGKVTALDRSQSDRIYNPAVLALSMFFSDAVQERRLRTSPLAVSTAVDSLTPEEQEYFGRAIDNFYSMSRTSSGSIDRSSNANKPAVVLEQEIIAMRARDNFVNAVVRALNDRKREFESAAELKQFVLELADEVTRDMEPKGKWRSWEVQHVLSDGRTVVQQSPSEAKEGPSAEFPDGEQFPGLNQFFRELYQRMHAGDVNPLSTVAWAIQRFDGALHPRGDGCCKISLVLSTFLCARFVSQMPLIRDRSEYYSKINLPLDKFEEYLASLVTPFIAYRFGVLDAGNSVEADAFNEPQFSDRTLGIELLNSKLVERCQLGHIDPLRSLGTSELASVEVALECDLPLHGAHILTGNPGLAAYAAMAVLKMRADGFSFPADSEARSRITRIAEDNKFVFGSWLGPESFPTNSEPWSSEELDRLGLDIKALGAMANDRSLPLAVKVANVEAWIAEGELAEKYRIQVDTERRKLISQIETGEIQYALSPDGLMCFVRSSHPQALRMAYRLAPVVIHINPSVEFNWRGPFRRMAVAQYDPTYVDLNAVLRELNELERGWGGFPVEAPKVIGSPLSCHTVLSEAQVAEVVRDSLIVTPEPVPESTAPIEVRSRAHLVELLTAHGVPIDSWGQGKAKTIDHLWHEIVAGECRLVFRAGRLLRKLDLVNVDVQYVDRLGERYQLREAGQVFCDGRRRRRDRDAAFATKLRSKEDVEGAALRVISEKGRQLGLRKSIKPKFLASYQRIQNSPSFPGLDSHYTIHVHALSIPTNRYKHDGPRNIKNQQEDKTTHYRWQRVRG